jgi:hypothetical protein
MDILGFLMDLGMLFSWLISPFVKFPPLAFLPAAVFFATWIRLRSKNCIGILLTGIMWLLFGLYETGMYFWSRTVIAPIRVDLAMVSLVLFIVTAIGILNLVRWYRD